MHHKPPVREPGGFFFGLTMRYFLKVIFHCRAVQPGHQAMSLRGVSSGHAFASASEAVARAEVLMASARLTGSWNAVLDGMTDLRQGTTWSYDLIRGIDRVEVRDQSGAIAEVAMVIAGPTLVWADPQSRELVVLLALAERASLRAAQASDERRAQKYRRVADRIHATATLRALVNFSRHIDRERAR